MNFTKYSKLLVLIITPILVSLFFWLAFYYHLPDRLGFPSSSLETVFANYDGPNYMVISKCGYQKSCIAKSFSLPNPLEYYPAHLPGYPLLIKYLSWYTTTPKAMLLATLIGSIFLTLVTYQFYLQFLGKNTSFYLALLSIFIPGRFLILRLVGAPETWFIGFILLSVVLFYKKHYFYSALMGALALLFKSPGILLFGAYGLLGLVEVYQTKTFFPVLKKYVYYFLIPLTALGIFYVYYLQTGDFWAYFHSGDNIHLSFLPYTVFISNHTWINTIWLEDVLYILFIALFAVTRLFKKYKLTLVTIFPLVFVAASALIAHRDISRYIAPAYPFFLLAFAKTLNRRGVKIICLLLAPALILYAINFIIGNTAPIADWTPYL